jgi:hypothetical protein
LVQFKGASAVASDRHSQQPAELYAAAAEHAADRSTRSKQGRSRRSRGRRRRRKEEEEEGVD